MSQDGEASLWYRGLHGCHSVSAPTLLSLTHTHTHTSHVIKHVDFQPSKKMILHTLTEKVHSSV